VRYVLFIATFGILFSCGEKKEEVVDLKDIMPQSERYKDGPADTLKKDTVYYGFDIWLAEKAGITVMELDLHEEPVFQDRFNARSVKKLDLQFKDGVAFFGQWTFKDSIKTMNAFYNWIDCFGEKCKSIRFLEETKFQTDPMLVFLNDTSITYLSSSLPLDEKKWQKYLQLKNGVELWDLVVIQKKQRKAGWYYYGIDAQNKKDTLFIKYEKRP
jgi:hypothetical protein